MLSIVMLSIVMLLTVILSTVMLFTVMIFTTVFLTMVVFTFLSTVSTSSHLMEPLAEEGLWSFIFLIFLIFLILWFSLKRRALEDSRWKSFGVLDRVASCLDGSSIAP